MPNIDMNIFKKDDILIWEWFEGNSHEFHLCTVSEESSRNHYCTYIKVQSIAVYSNCPEDRNRASSYSLIDESLEKILLVHIPKAHRLYNRYLNPVYFDGVMIFEDFPEVLL